MERFEERRNKLLQINIRQAEFYDRDSSKQRSRNKVEGAWAQSRNAMSRYRAAIGINEFIHQLHRQWLGDLQHAHVLDLGCGKGAPMSLEIASKSRSYLGIDLSKHCTESLNKKLAERKLTNANALSIDFLSPSFKEGPFDVIYAHSIVHHFSELDVFLKVLKEKLSPNGRVITVDPMETAFSVWAARKVYRPFQRDAEWEIPFQRKTIRMIAANFEIEKIRGYMGLAKWGLGLVTIPFLTESAIKLGRKLDQFDRRFAQRQGWALWNCMAATMLLRPKQESTDLSDRHPRDGSATELNNAIAAD